MKLKQTAVGRKILDNIQIIVRDNLKTFDTYKP